MLMRMLSVMLIALAMLAAPLTMREGMAMEVPASTAAMHHPDPAAPHHGPTKAPGHCEQQNTPDQDQSHKATGGNCCVATCVAVVAPMGTGDLPAYHPLAERPTSDADRLGTLAEIATPPPRRA